MVKKTHPNKLVTTIIFLQTQLRVLVSLEAPITLEKFWLSEKCFPTSDCIVGSTLGLLGILFLVVERINSKAIFWIRGKKKKKNQPYHIILALDLTTMDF